MRWLKKFVDRRRCCSIASIWANAVLSRRNAIEIASGSFHFQCQCSQSENDFCFLRFVQWKREQPNDEWMGLIIYWLQFLRHWKCTLCGLISPIRSSNEEWLISIKWKCSAIVQTPFQPRFTHLCSGNHTRWHSLTNIAKGAWKLSQKVVCT